MDGNGTFTCTRNWMYSWVWVCAHTDFITAYHSIGWSRDFHCTFYHGEILQHNLLWIVLFLLLLLFFSLSLSFFRLCFCCSTCFARRSRSIYIYIYTAQYNGRALWYYCRCYCCLVSALFKWKCVAAAIATWIGWRGGKNEIILIYAKNCPNEISQPEVKRLTI